MSRDTDSCMTGITLLVLATLLVPLGGLAGYFLAGPLIIILFVAGISAAIWITHHDFKLGDSGLAAEMFGFGLMIGSLVMASFAIGVRWDKIGPFVTKITQLLLR